MVNQSITSPNFDPDSIKVEFVVLHYTACDLYRTLEIFTDPAKEVSSHLIIAENGEVFELVRCWYGTTYRAWHAGPSRWIDKGKVWDNLNDFSIGIELVNFNGNILPYTPDQYVALARVIQHLKSLYPSLELPTRILGHEHIASFRGKIDPGRMFDWHQFFELVYPNQVAPSRTSICPYELQEALKNLVDLAPKDKETETRFWEMISFLAETSVRLIQKAKS